MRTTTLSLLKLAVGAGATLCAVSVTSNVQAVTDFTGAPGGGKDAGSDAGHVLSGSAAINLGGNACFSNNYTAPSQYHPWGATNRSTSSTITIDCPVAVNDSITTSTTTSLGVEIWFYDRNTSANIDCNIGEFTTTGLYQ